MARRKDTDTYRFIDVFTTLQNQSSYLAAVPVNPSELNSLSLAQLEHSHLPVLPPSCCVNNMASSLYLARLHGDILLYGEVGW
jgi:hypothetical protein